VNDKGLKQIAGLKSLRTLDLQGAEITVAALKELARLPKLQSLTRRDHFLSSKRGLHQTHLRVRPRWPAPDHNRRSCICPNRWRE